MATNNRRRNENFYDEYRYFDLKLCKKYGIEEDGVGKYMDLMKHAVVEAREQIPEWDSIYERLAYIKKRYYSLENAELSFDEFQGKDEDVVWMRIFMEKIDSMADPLYKYSQMTFIYKKRRKTLLQRISNFLKGGSQ